MNRLVLVGNMVHVGENKFVQFRTASKTHLLPIKSKDDFESGAWVRFEGVLSTNSVWDAALGRRRKLCFGEGDISITVSREFDNTFSLLGGSVVRIFELRTTPLTRRKIVDFVVAKGEDYFNCIVFGKDAERLISTKKVGDDISISKALFHSREYTKNGEAKTAYEVCVRDFS